MRSLRDEAKLRRVSIFHVVECLTLPMKRAAAAKKLQSWFKTWSRHPTSPESVDSECNDSSSIGDSSDSEYEMHEDISACTLQESLVTSRVRPCTAIGKETLRLIQSRLDGGCGEERINEGTIMKEALQAQVLFAALRISGHFVWGLGFRV